jgi:predicted ATP-dependent endonuclease of OLD family
LKIGGHINQITFNNDETVDINKNDIVIFVGSNNVGKSQALNDIYNLTNSKVSTVIIKEVKVEKSVKKSLLKYINEISILEEQENHNSFIRGFNYSFHSGSINNIENEYSFYVTRDIFVSYLNTENRLLICKPAQLINRDQQKSHPIHFAAFEPEYRKMLSKKFKQAFGIALSPNIQFGQTIPLCMGELEKPTGDFSDVMEIVEALGDKLATYKQVQDQGDGMRSFTGILLHLMLERYCIHLIDEPESFLHPPQANIMGRVIGELLSNEQQAFIATHSQDIIKGLLDVCPDRVKIIRITREGDINSFSILENAKFNEIWSDPLLKHSTIMDSLFASSTVLCEADSDCRMYSIILSHLKSKEGKYSETHFIHCGGKHRMAKIIPALKSLNVDFRVIPDCDVMNDENVFKGIIESCGGDWNNFQRDYNVISSGLSGGRNNIHRDDTKRFINKLLDASTTAHLTKDEIKEIYTQLKITTKWSQIKDVGFSAIPSGDATASFLTLNEKLKSLGVFLVPCGEIEQFIKDIGKHGPEWVNEVLETHTNFDDDTYKTIREFVASWNI